MMQKPLITVISVIGIVVNAAPAVSRTTRPVATAQQLVGHWKVDGVAVLDNSVQALTSNDPTYMGKRLTFTAARLSWDKPTNTTQEVCTQPKIRQTQRDKDADDRAAVRRIGGPALRGFSVTCATGSLGPRGWPSAAILALSDGTIGLWWYDGGLLKLRRVD